MTYRKTLSVDFDGVLHSYQSPWVNARVIPDPPVPGAFDWLGQAVRSYQVAVFSSRSGQPGGIQAMRQWFQDHGLPADVLDQMEFPTEKPPAHLSIDDRAFHFQGTFPTFEFIEGFKPWNKLPPK